MKKQICILVLSALLLLSFSSCNTYQHSMRVPNTKVELKSSDFELSEQFTAEATSTEILYIDWAGIFGTTYTGVMGDIPVIGTTFYGRAANEALYKLMQEHPGYDVVFYPQFEKHEVAPILGTGLYRTVTVKVTARLGKLKK